ncbi:hypothetical protein HX89_10770 [Dermacoccus nishinomiyaensis]|uniref:Uncharacterized protein n=1 Tax=Dermacoccus nishinomiyaensis TaxID=1274 RepID=A0A075JHN0_9MICO|nr:hypothetical protein HX89_10770 [Dermacoccus nishinomiyaensis]
MPRAAPVTASLFVARSPDGALTHSSVRFGISGTRAKLRRTPNEHPSNTGHVPLRHRRHLIGLREIPRQPPCERRPHIAECTIQLVLRERRRAEHVQLHGLARSPHGRG